MGVIHIGAANEVLRPLPTALSAGAFTLGGSLQAHDEFYAIAGERGYWRCQIDSLQSFGGRDRYGLEDRLRFELDPDGWGPTDGYAFGRAAQAGLTLSFSNWQSMAQWLWGRFAEGSGRPNELGFFAEQNARFAAIVHGEFEIPVPKVLWGIENEPSNSTGNWGSTPLEFFFTYAAYAYGVRSAVPNARMGGAEFAGPATKGWAASGNDTIHTNNFERWLLWSAKPPDYEPFWQGRRIPIDFLSYHFFGGGLAPHWELLEIRRYIDAAGYSPTTQILMTEVHLNNNDGGPPSNRDTLPAIDFLRTMVHGARYGLTAQLYAVVARGAITDPAGFDNAYGIWTQVDPLCHDTKGSVLKMVAELQENEIACDDNDDDNIGNGVWAIASASADRTTRAVLICRYPSTWNVPFPPGPPEEIPQALFVDALIRKYGYRWTTPAEGDPAFFAFFSPVYFDTGMPSNHATDSLLTYMNGTSTLPAYFSNIPGKLEGNTLADELADGKVIALIGDANASATITVDLDWQDAASGLTWARYDINESSALNNPHVAYLLEYASSSNFSLAVAAAQAAQTLTPSATGSGPPPTSFTMERFSATLIVATGIAPPALAGSVLAELEVDPLVRLLPLTRIRPGGSARPEIFFRRNDMLFRLTNIRREDTGEFLNAATIEITLYQTDLQAVFSGQTWPLALPYSGTPGQYEAVISRDVDFLGEEQGTAYVTIDEGPVHAEFMENFLIQTRSLS